MSKRDFKKQPYTAEDRQDAKSLAESTVAMRKPQYNIDSKQIRRDHAKKMIDKETAKFDRQVKKGIRHPAKKEAELAGQQRALADLILELKSDSAPLSDKAQENLDIVKKPSPGEKAHDDAKKGRKAADTWPLKRSKK